MEISLSIEWIVSQGHHTPLLAKNFLVFSLQTTQHKRERLSKRKFPGLALFQGPASVVSFVLLPLSLSTKHPLAKKNHPPGRKRPIVCIESTMPMTLLYSSNTLPMNNG